MIHFFYLIVLIIFSFMFYKAGVAQGRTEEAEIRFKEEEEEKSA
jgi:hypothetical protein